MFHSTPNKTGRLPVPLVIILDILLITATLIVYALFQHVLPAYASASSAPALAISQLQNDTEKETEESPEELLTPAEKFADHFSEETIETETLYSSPEISIELSAYISEEGSGQRWYVEDIYLTDISYFQTMTPGGVYSSAVGSIYYTTREMNALAAINGDFSAFGHNGYIVRNGILRENEASLSDICALYYDGTMICYGPGEFDAEQALENGVWQTWNFGPSLLDSNGKAMTEFNELYSSISGANPRTAIGYYEPGHYCFVVADGRQAGAEGFSLSELSSIMEELGCSAAYNLDGGASSQMMFNGELTNIPVDDGRAINDMIIIRKEPAGEDQ